jgi:hypothetical protein
VDDGPWDPPRDPDGWASVLLEAGAGGVPVLVPRRAAV